MPVWSVGSNLPGYMPDVPPAVFADFDEAVDYLKSEMLDFAQTADGEFLDLSEDPPSQEAYVEALFAPSDGDFPRVEDRSGPVPVWRYVPGEHCYQLQDSGGWGRMFFLALSEEEWWNFPGVDEEPRSAQEALEEWIRTEEIGLSEEDQDFLFQYTNYQADAATNIAAIAQGAAYLCLDLDDLGYPLPVVIQ